MGQKKVHELHFTSTFFKIEKKNSDLLMKDYLTWKVFNANSAKHQKFEN